MLPLTRLSPLLLLFLLLLLSPSFTQPQELHEEEGGLHESFLRCVSRLSPDTADPSELVHAPADASYPPLLASTIQNLRFASPRTPRPSLLLTPRTVTEVQASVACCKAHGLAVRARSGGHDYEGLSYRATRPSGGRLFAVIDVAALLTVRVDAARRVARAQPGATLGELYYAVAEGSGGALGFPAGICPTVCVGGHLSGGGFGPMMRKYGLAADNVVDAEVVDAGGRLLKRAAMGEDLFWAIRGGGGGSFGIVVSWTVSLVPVPSVVSAFTVRRLLRRGDEDEQAMLRLLTKWQLVAHALPDDLFVKLAMEPKDADGGKRRPLVMFKSLFLGNCSEMITQMGIHLPELDIKSSDCREMNWIQSTLYFYGYTNGQPAEVEFLSKRTTCRVELSKETTCERKCRIRPPLPPPAQAAGTCRHQRRRPARRVGPAANGRGGRQEPRFGAARYGTALQVVGPAATARGGRHCAHARAPADGADFHDADSEALFAAALSDRH